MTATIMGWAFLALAIVCMIGGGSLTVIWGCIILSNIWFAANYVKDCR